ncbi:MAG: hypothetical protein ACP5HK_07420, partial [Acidilobus sp.]
MASRRTQRRPPRRGHSLAQRLEGLWPYVAYGLLALIVGLTAYVRLIPYLRYGPTLSEVDPYEYLWLADYFRSHGPHLVGLARVTFWWFPWGRDFLATEYLGLPMLTALFSWLLRTSTEVALSLSPVAFAVLGVLGSFLAVKAMRGGLLGPLVAAAGFAFLPILVMDHGFATDPAKVFDGIALLPYQVYFLARSYGTGDPRRSLAYALASGASGGVIAWMWGGYQYTALVVALAAVLEPFLMPPSLPGLYRLLAAWLGFSATAITSPAVSPHLFTRGVGLAAEASISLYALEALVQGRRPCSVRLHIWGLSVLVGLAVVALLSGFLSLPSRVVMGLGLQYVGGVVPLTVQEYMGQPIQAVIAAFAPFFVLTLISLVVLVAGRASGRLRGSPTDVVVLASMALTLVFTFASANQAYYAPSAALFSLISGSVSVPLLTSLAWPQAPRKRPREEGRRWGVLVGVGLLSLMALAPVAYYAVIDAQ